jgi:hypothetical protein
MVAVVLGLSFAPAWTTAVSAPGRRHKRLAVLDVERVDRTHKAVLIRRDDVEYLLLTGGPAELVIEKRSVAHGPRAHRDGGLPSPAAYRRT